MPADLRERLQSMLGHDYAIDSEIGGGGMSRVFSARESALGRPVVVKVLPPELVSAINVERFRREIQLAAQLQHPHIVPLLSAAESGGLLFYTMPRVDGESLRARLDRSGELPIADAVRLLRELADALAYAHRHGVVHRDVKPDNVLCADGHALITDFGVAKALSLSSGVGTATSPGVAIGTPTYMSPEQASGDPQVDSRADVYGFGALAYEVLTGRPPFQRANTQALLAAHIAEAPVPIETLRPALPPALAALVMQCLEKRPADRPQGAAEVLRVLDALGTTGGGSRVVAAAPSRMDASRRWLVLAGLLLALLAVLLAVRAARDRSDAPAVQSGVVAVLPFQVTASDSSLGYLREGMVDLLAAQLTGEGGQRAANPRTTLAAWRRATGGDGGALDERGALGVARQIGADGVLLGAIVGSPARLTMSASLLSSADGAERARARVEGPADSLAVLVDALAGQLLAGSVGVHGDRLSSVAHTPLAALRAYVEGARAYRSGHYIEAGLSYERALETDSTFALAALGLSAVGDLAGSGTWPEDGARMAWRHRDRLSARDRHVLDAFVGSKYPATRTIAESIQDYQELTFAEKDNADAWYWYGERLFHYGALIELSGAADRARAAFERAVALDSTFAAPLERLIALAGRTGDERAVVRFGRLYLSHAPAGEAADWVGWRVAMLTGDSAGAARIESRLATDVNVASLGRFATDPVTEAIPTDVAERASDVLLGRGGSRYWTLYFRAGLEQNRGRPSSAARARGEMRRLVVGERLTVLRPMVTDAIFAGGDSAAGAAAVTALARMAARSPTTGADEERRVGAICDVGRWRITWGDTSSTQRTLALLRSANSAEAELCAAVLAAQRASLANDGAAAALARLDSLVLTGTTLPLWDFGSVNFANLVSARLHERAGDYPGALRAIRRRDYDVWYPAHLAASLREEGRLAAITGDTAGAVRAYRHYLAIRRDPEPSVRPEVEGVRQALARLEARRPD